MTANMVDEDDDFLMGHTVYTGPRIRHIRIDHASATFVAAGSHAFDPTPMISGIPLIGIHQRTLWAPRHLNLDLTGPLCRSPNGIFGYPTAAYPHGPVITPDMAVPRKSGPTPLLPDGFDSGEFKTIACDICPLKDWGEGGPGRRQPPACRDSYVLGIITPEDLNSEYGGVTAVEMSGSAVRVYKDFKAEFSRQQKPLFFTEASVELSMMSKGTSRFASPRIERLADTAPELHDLYAGWTRWFRSELLASFRPPRDPSRKTEGARSGFEGIE